MERARQWLGAYEVVGRIAQGGMGTVYRGRDLRSGFEVALKVLRTGGQANPDQRERFRREVEALKRLRHENLLSVLDAGESASGQPWLAMPLVEGVTLEEHLARHGPLPIDEVWDLASQLGAALEFVHATGLIHRDLKPENLIRQGAQGLVRWVVTDFGLAKDLEVEESQALSKTGAILGTPGYWAPEQASARPSGPYTDVYGAGAVLYAASTGVPPVSGQTFWEAVVATENQVPRAPRELRREVPVELSELILRCLEKEPGARFADGQELLAAVKLLEEANARGGSRGLGLVLAIALVLLGVGLALAVPRSPGPPSPTPEPSQASTPGLTQTLPSAKQESPDEIFQDALRAQALRLKVGLDGVQDLDEAERLLERAAEAGSSVALCELAELLVTRRGPEIDLAARERRALAWLERGAQLGSPRALRGLGHMHLDGLAGLEPDRGRARELYKQASKGDVDALFALTATEGEIERTSPWIEQIAKAAKRGEPNACYFVYLIQESPTLAKAPLGPAQTWLEKAARGGSPKAQVDLAWSRMSGRGASDEAIDQGFDLLFEAVKAGDTDAIAAYGRGLCAGLGSRARQLKLGATWLERAARLGHATAMRNHSMALHEGAHRSRDDKAALFWAQQSALRGDAQALVLVGSAYLEGEGVEQDPKEAVRWFQRAAARGIPEGRHAMAVARLQGKGVEADPTRALETLEELAEEGLLLALVSLGRVYFDGEVVDRDLRRARDFFKRAAERGQSAAYLYYAELLAKGEGGQADLPAARAWIEKAIEDRVPGARRVLARLEALESTKDEEAPR